MLFEEYNFKREVLDDSGPVLVSFYSPGNAACAELRPVIEALARDFKVCTVNADSNPKLAAKFDVSAVPLLLIFHGGKVVRWFERPPDEARVRSALEALAGG
jgi:thioredoxin 1